MTLRTIQIDLTDGRIAPADYAVIASWWTQREGNPPARAILPTLGVIASFDGQPVATCFAYLDATGSGVAILAWHITNPQANPFHAGRGLDHCRDFLEQHCAALNYHTAWTTTSSPQLSRHLTKHGYQIAEKAMTHHIRPLP